MVFAVSKKQTEHSMVGNVLLLGQLNQGTWKPCEMERVLRGNFTCMGRLELNEADSLRGPYCNST